MVDLFIYFFETATLLKQQKRYKREILQTRTQANKPKNTGKEKKTLRQKDPYKMHGQPSYSPLFGRGICHGISLSLDMQEGSPKRCGEI